LRSQAASALINAKNKETIATYIAQKAVQAGLIT